MYKTTNMEIKDAEFILKNYSQIGLKKCYELLNIPKHTISYFATKNKLKVSKEANSRINSESKTKIGTDCKVNSDFFINECSPESMYILGLLWGDGYLRKNSDDNTINLECVTEDMNYFKTILLHSGEWTFYSRKRANRKESTKAHTTNKILKDFLIENDFLNKSFLAPHKILNLFPQNLMSYFLLGYVDADGCFYLNKKHSTRQFSITSTINQDWSIFITIFNNLNVKNKVIRFENSKNGYSQLRIFGLKNINKIGNFIYKTIEKDKIGLIRKYSKYLEIVNQ